MLKVGDEVITNNGLRGHISFIEDGYVSIELPSGAEMDYYVDDLKLYVAPESKPEQSTAKYPSIYHNIIFGMIEMIPLVAEDVSKINIDDTIYQDILDSLDNLSNFVNIAEKMANAAVDLDPKVGFIFDWNYKSGYQQLLICSMLIGIKPSKMVKMYKEGKMARIMLTGYANMARFT